MTIPAEATIPPESQALDNTPQPGPFEGPEKLLELWFAPTPDSLPESSTTARLRAERAEGSWKGLRKVPREVWEGMLDIVKCKVLSVVEGEDIDAYLLSESSLFVAPHLLILKTCGTTLNLLGLYRIIEIAREYCGLTTVWRCFYSRKSFFFPERQHGPHRDWRDEVNFLDSVFGTAGAAYTVGPMNRDHWLLYLTSPNSQPLLPSDSALSTSVELNLTLPPTPPPTPPSVTYQDSTLEILMTHLSPAARAPFFAPTNGSPSGHEMGQTMTRQLGIDQLFPPDETTIDSFGFEPCGYSANAVIGTGLPKTHSNESSVPGGGYFTIHVTPEDGWSYASFECNVPLPFKSSLQTKGRPDLPSLIQRVINIFQPSRLSITLFVSTSIPSMGQGTATTETEQRAWSAFSPESIGGEYVRKDRIGYEFDGYDLVFACFERRGWVEPRGIKQKVVLAIEKTLTG